MKTVEWTIRDGFFACAQLVFACLCRKMSKPASPWDISVVNDVCVLVPNLVPNRALEDLYLTRSIAMLEGVEVFVEKRTW